MSKTRAPAERNGSGDFMQVHFAPLEREGSLEDVRSINISSLQDENPKGSHASAPGAIKQFEQLAILPIAVASAA